MDAVLIACHHCGMVHRVPPLADGMAAVCTRCRSTLFRHRPEGIDRALALYLSALLLFGVANLFPLMTMHLGGLSQSTTLLQGVRGLWRAHMEVLAILVLLAAILLPLLKILGALYVLVHARLGRGNRSVALVYRLVGRLQPWAMTEVYLLGLIVAWVKMKDLASVELDVALVGFIGLIVTMAWADASLEPHDVWERVQPQMRAPPGRIPPDDAFLGCHDCDQLVAKAALADPHHARCPRCLAALHERKPDSLTRVTALLIAAAILYIPANLLPVMTVTMLGAGEPDTILSGVVVLIAVGMWPVAALIFFASITVPVLKLIGLIYLLITVRRGSPKRQRDRTRMYQLIELVGRWSMVDIFVIAILVALVDLGEIATIAPGPGAAAFAAVVVLTMIASEMFDPRLIWDAREKGDEHADRSRHHAEAGIASAGGRGG